MPSAENHQWQGNEIPITDLGCSGSQKGLAISEACGCPTLGQNFGRKREKAVASDDD